MFVINTVATPLVESTHTNDDDMRIVYKFLYTTRYSLIHNLWKRDISQVDISCFSQFVLIISQLPFSPSKIIPVIFIFFFKSKNIRINSILKINQFCFLNVNKIEYIFHQLGLNCWFAILISPFLIFKIRV